MPAGDRAHDLELSALIQAVIITDHRDQTAADIARALGHPVADLLDSPFMLVGTVADVADQILRLRHDHGVGYLTVTEPYADALAPVLAHLA